MLKTSLYKLQLLVTTDNDNGVDGVIDGSSIIKNIRNLAKCKKVENLVKCKNIEKLFKFKNLS